MRLLRLILCSVVLLGCAQSDAVAAASPQQQVDALFAKWNHKDTPGCAIAVIKDGKIVYRRGYGMADIEHSAPNLPTTPFHIASMSKQFTAFAIHLLAQDGKLSLDDNLRKYLPEMPDFGQPITIRELLHHTSGLRDQWGLLGLAGWRLDDVITEDDVYGLLKRQKALNFNPGTQELYSNTGYTLLAMIVKRVSGKPLPEFAQERIFAPLGMKHTRFHDIYGTLVPGRAMSYEPLPQGGYEYVALSYSIVGATSLFTTVEDLALWDQNFYDGKVGGKELLAEMQTPGVLASGKQLDYASGLILSSYRGLKMVSHSGGDAGYRSDLLRFPEQHFSVAILANAAESDPSQLARQVADIYLGKQMRPLPASKAQQEISVDAASLDALVGDYAITPQFIIGITKEHGRLMAQATGQGKVPMFASGERRFFLKVADVQIMFEAPDKDGVIAGLTLRQNGHDVAARRIKRATLSDAALRAFDGEYYSDELHVLYTVTHKDGELALSYPRGKMKLSQISPTAFNADYPIGRVQFNCGAQGACSGLKVSNGRVLKLQFAKVTFSTASPQAEVIYLRGSMNDWGLNNPLQEAVGAQRYAATIKLNKGHYEFKLGSEDYDSIDLGAAKKERTTDLGKSHKLETRGANLSIDVPETADYSFTLDTSDQQAPTITVSEEIKSL